MPGPVSDSSKGLGGRTPYVPSHCYPAGKPKMCPCGHHEGFHGGKLGACLLKAECGCTGLPLECFTSDDDLHIW